MNGTVGATYFRYAVTGDGKRFLVFEDSGTSPPAMKLLWFATIAGPALLVAALFFANWLKRQELHARA
jgi:hypothetical protein